MARRLKVHIGLQRLNRRPYWPSEPMYVKQMQQQSRALTDTLLDIFDQFENASTDIMLEALLPTAELAYMYTPEEYGPLRESQYLESTTFRGKPRVELGYAKGGQPPYAMYVHEIESYSHAAPTRPKFLETAMKEDLEGIYFRLATLYKQFMFGGSSG